MLHIGADSALTKDGLPVDGACEPLSMARMILQHHASLLGFLRRRLRISEDADDVAQEAYVRMMQYEGSREIRSPASLLFRIAINVAHDLGRYQVTHKETDRRSLEDVELVCELPSAEREIQGRQDVELVYRAIEEMPPKCRQVFLLSRVRKMTQPEIARHCGISLKAVEKHISRGLAICAQKVGGLPRRTS